MPTGRGTFMLAPPPTEQQMKPAATPPPVPAGGAPPPMTPPPVPAGGAPQAPRVVTPVVPPQVTTVTPTTAGGPPPTIATRTNNPGNIKDGPFARAQPGYVGQGPPATDGGSFAVFESPESGHAAMGQLLQRPGYQGLPVGQALERWSNGGYGANVAMQAGIVFAIAVARAPAPVTLVVFMAGTAELVTLARDTWGAVGITIGAIGLFVLAALMTSDLYRATTAGLMLAGTGLVAFAVGRALVQTK